MKDTWVEPESGVWVIEGRSPRIEYSLKLMEEICGAAMSGLRKLSRGGIEIGGVLYGEHDANVVRIRAWRPIDCEHGKGPAFLLSLTDIEALEGLLRNSDPALEGLRPVGWFVSHTRTGINLRAEDQAIFEHSFPEPWQVTLVLHPVRHRGTDAGFFFREPDGALQTASSAKVFRVAAFASLSSPAEPPPPVAPLQRRRQPREQRPPLMPAAPEQESPGPAEIRRTGSRRLMMALWILLLLSLAGVGAYYFHFTGRAPVLGFRLFDIDGEMHLEWDQNSPALQGAARGELTITDGAKKVTWVLTSEILRQGRFVYMRTSDDVEARLTIFRRNRTVASESSRFLGQPTSRAYAAEISRLVGEQTLLRTERQAAIAKQQALKKQLDDERARNRWLQRQVRSLELELSSFRNQPRRP